MTESVLFVCRANLCRSPSAEVMLTRALTAVHVEATVSSVGMEVVEGQSAPDDFVELAYMRGIDLRAHKPVAFTPELALSYSLVLTMTRDLLRTMVIEAPPLWPTSFTLLELVRRGTSIEPPERGDDARDLAQPRPSLPGPAPSSSGSTTSTTCAIRWSTPSRTTRRCSASSSARRGGSPGCCRRSVAEVPHEGRRV